MKIARALRAAYSAIAHWGVIEYFWLSVLWAAMSLPLAMLGWGWLSVFSLPLLLLLLVGLIEITTRLVGPAYTPIAREPRLSGADAIPAEVRDFLAAAKEFNDSSARIFILNIAESVRYSDLLWGSPIYEGLGLIALDDANDSNPYCYITKGVAAGMVLHLTHDREPRIKFACLKDFHDFLLKIKREGKMLYEAQVDPLGHTDQDALYRTLCELAEKELDENSEFAACLYLPLVRDGASEALGRLMKSESFFVRECIANTIAEANLVGARHLLDQLQQDVHPQVRRAADRALGVYP